MRTLSLIAATLVLCVSAPALAGKREDQLAACMWQRMPQSAVQFVDAKTPQEGTKGLFDGLVVCGEGNMNINTKALKKRLEETRPAEIPANTEKPDVFICMKTAEGTCEVSE